MNRNTLFLLAGIILGVGGCLLYENFVRTDFASEALFFGDEATSQEKLIFPTADAQVMLDDYMNGPHRIRFYRMIEGRRRKDYLNGFRYSGREMDSIIHQEGLLCDSVYVMFGRRKDAATNRNQLTTIIQAKRAGHIELMSLDYAHPCPPYCPR